MSVTDLLKRNLAASITIAVSCGVAFSLSASAERPVTPAKPGDTASAKFDGSRAERIPGDAKFVEPQSGGAGAKSSAGFGVANGATASVKNGSKLDVTGGAKSDVKTGTTADGTNGSKTNLNRGSKTDAATGIGSDMKTGAGVDVETGKSDVMKSTKSGVTAGARDEGTVDTKLDATSGAESDGSVDPDIKGSEAKQITPIDANSADNAEVEEDPYAQYNKQQMALFQQHEAVQHYNAAKYYMKSWDNELAELELRAAIMYMPELRIAHRDYCIVAILRGKLLRAIAEFCMVFGIGEPLALTQEQQAALRTEASQGHYKKGLELATKGNWDESISELMWARTYLPNDPAIHRSLAFAYSSKGDFKMAEQYYQSTFSIDPNDAFAHADFAYLLSKKGKKDEAVSEMAKAVKADPDSTALHVDLGWLAESKGDLKTAEAEFRAALNRAPQYGQLWYHLGQILERRKKPSDALAAYKTAVEKEPSNMQAKEALARLGSPVLNASSNITPVKPTVPAESATQIKPTSPTTGAAPQSKPTTPASGITPIK